MKRSKDNYFLLSTETTHSEFTWPAPVRVTSIFGDTVEDIVPNGPKGTYKGAAQFPVSPDFPTVGGSTNAQSQSVVPPPSPPAPAPRSSPTPRVRRLAAPMAWQLWHACPWSAWMQILQQICITEAGGIAVCWPWKARNIIMHCPSNGDPLTRRRRQNSPYWRD